VHPFLIRDLIAAILEIEKENRHGQPVQWNQFLVILGHSRS
jgi:hypothetical protein